MWIFFLQEWCCVRATTQTSAAPLGSVSDVKCLDHDANLKYLMRGKAGQRTGSVEHKCKHVNARYVHTDTSNIRSMIHILQIHNLCCCRLQQRQVEDQEHSAHRVRRKPPYINDDARNEYHHFSYFPPPSFLLADQQARPVTASDCWGIGASRRWNLSPVFWCK